MSSERISCRETCLPIIIVDMTSPVVVRRRRQAAITVSVRGNPAPRVTWYVGRNRKPVSTCDKCFRCEEDVEGRHTLVVLSVSTVLDDGVLVVADNDFGHDSCLVDVKTYRGAYFLHTCSCSADVTNLQQSFLELRWVWPHYPQSYAC